jgi:hypothetical protein
VRGSPLGGAGDRVPLGAILAEDAGLEERLHQGPDPLVPDSIPDPSQKSGVGDLVEARRDVALKHPLVGVGCEEVDLGDRVLYPAFGAKAVAARLKSASKIGSSSSLSAACTTRSATVAIPSRRTFPPRLGIRRSRTGRGANLRVFSSSRRPLSSAWTPRPASIERAVSPSTPADRAPLFARTGARQPAGPPGHGQGRKGHRTDAWDRRSPIGAAWSGSLVPAPRPPQGSATARRFHRRPPGLPVAALPTRCRPSPCDRLSRSRTTTAAPSPPSTIGRRRACPPPTWPAGGEGDPGRVPAFTMHRLAGAMPQLFPCSLATATPQTFPVASGPADATPTTKSRINR